MKSSDVDRMISARGRTQGLVGALSTLNLQTDREREERDKLLSALMKLEQECDTFLHEILSKHRAELKKNEDSIRDQLRGLRC